MRRVVITALATAAIALGTSTAALAVTVSGDGLAVGGVHSGQDCPITGPGNPGFSGCWATQAGTTADPGEDATASQVVAQIALTGTSDISDNYDTIDGSEFTLSLGD